MGYRYSAVHNTIIHDGKDDDDDKRVIRDGGCVRVPLMMRDSSSPPPGAKMWHHSPIPMRDSTQRSIAGSGSPGEDGTSRVPPRWAMDQAAQILGRDSVTIDGDVELISRQELIDFDKAQLSAAWKGGLQDGDRVRIGDRDLVVSGRNPTNGKIQLSDASTSAQDAETARRNAYVAYDRDIQRSWMNTHDAKAGDRCTTAGRESGTWREKNGRLICVPDDKSSKPDEWAIAGPLSDAERVQVRDEMYASYDADLAQRWKTIGR